MPKVIKTGQDNQNGHSMTLRILEALRSGGVSEIVEKRPATKKGTAKKPS